jgi:hypothetical protein
MWPPQIVWRSNEQQNNSSSLLPYLSKHMEKNHRSISKAVIALHEKGFTEDFTLTAHSLTWVQQKVQVHKDGFSVEGKYRAYNSAGKEYNIFALSLNGTTVHGILMIPVSKTKQNYLL